MPTSPDPLDRLLSMAAGAEPELLPEIPHGFATRVLALSRPPASLALPTRLFRTLTVFSCVWLLVAGTVAWQEIQTCSDLTGWIGSPIHVITLYSPSLLP